MTSWVGSGRKSAAWPTPPFPSETGGRPSLGSRSSVALQERVATRPPGGPHKRADSPRTPAGGVHPAKQQGMVRCTTTSVPRYWSAAPAVFSPTWGPTLLAPPIAPSRPGYGTKAKRRHRASICLTVSWETPTTAAMSRSEWPSDASSRAKRRRPPASLQALRSWGAARRVGSVESPGTDAIHITPMGMASGLVRDESPSLPPMRDFFIELDTERREKR